MDNSPKVSKKEIRLLQDEIDAIIGQTTISDNIKLLYLSQQLDEKIIKWVKTSKAEKK